MSEEVKDNYPFSTATDFRYARESYRTYRQQAQKHLELIGHKKEDYYAIKETARTFIERDAKSEIDPITGLPNERGFKRRAEIEVARARRDKTPITVGTADLNGLKHINDTLGHNAGTEYIRKAASILSIGNRPGDIVAHPHGDEYVFVLPGADLKGAQEWSRRKLTALQNAGIGIAIGIAQVDLQDPADAEVLLKKELGNADVELYKAKDESKKSNSNTVSPSMPKPTT